MNIKLIIKYLANNFLLQLLGLLSSAISINLLPLSELGIFNLAKSLSGSFQYTHLGLRYGLDRLLPEKGIQTNLSNMYITLLVNSIISFFLFTIYCYFFFSNFFFLLYILGGWFFATFTLIRVYYRGTGQVNYFIKITFTSNLLIILIPLLGIYIGGSKGLFIAYLLVCIFLFITYFPRRLFLIKWKKAYTINLSNLYKIGGPIFVTNIIVFLGDNVDKFIVNYFLGINAVGEFGIITLAYSLILMLPSLIVELVLPEYIKQKKFKKAIKNLFINHVFVGFLLITTAICLSYFVLPYFVSLFFFKYLYLVANIKIIILALLPYSLISPCYCLLFANDKSVKISIITIANLIIYFLLVYLLLKYEYTLEYILFAKILYTTIYCFGLIILLWQNGLIKKIFYDREEKDIIIT